MDRTIIRKAQFTDIKAVIEIEQESISSWTFDQFLNELNYEFSLFLVAEHEGLIAGYVIVWKVADEIQLNNIAVRKNLRGQGIGSKLLLEAAKSDSSQIYSSIILEVRSRNNEAINFYIDNGFTKTGVRKNYYNDDDALLMEKKL